MTIRMYEMLPPASLPDVQRIIPDGLDKYMWGYERNVLIALLNWLKAETVVEIGVQSGHCAIALLKNVPSIRQYIGIDVEPGYKTGLPSQQSEIPDRPGELVLQHGYFNLMTRPRGSLDLSECDLPTCDAMLIDGDHSECAVRQDSDLATHVVRPGGLILWHDYWPPWQNDVVKVLNELHRMGRNIRHIPNTWLAMEVN